MRSYLMIALGVVILGASAKGAQTIPARSRTDSAAPRSRRCEPACWQLRIYTINRGQLQEFEKAWRQGVYPLRLKHGFRIPAAWSITETNQFVWLIGYEGPDEWEAKEAAYYGSTERTTMNPDPRQWIARTEVLSLSPVSLTP